MYNCGIAMVDKEKLESSQNMKFTIDGSNTIIYDPVALWESIRQPVNEEKDEPQAEKKLKSKSISVTKNNQKNNSDFEEK
jgi:hypothetical protein